MQKNQENFKKSCKTACKSRKRIYIIRVDREKREQTKTPETARKKKMTIEELKKEATKCETFLAEVKTGIYARRAKKRLAQIKDAIFRLEDPALYQNYIDAEKAFYTNTKIF